MAIPIGDNLSSDVADSGKPLAFSFIRLFIRYRRIRPVDGGDLSFSVSRLNSGVINSTQQLQIYTLSSPQLARDQDPAIPIDQSIYQKIPYRLRITPYLVVVKVYELDPVHSSPYLNYLLQVNLSSDCTRLVR